ncbi:MAG TPA: hydrogenase maturation protease [Bryobacteraceae bacterium]|nr:hydrogenase maturation protease [Bryobacteraceae bacterium]
MTKVLIAGIGNVLLGDDGIGPFAIKLLEWQYDFTDNVELADLGTPGLDLPVHLAGADAVILVDSAKFSGEAGDIRLFRKPEILRHPSRARIDPHSPALTESIFLLELMGVMPREFLMIGMQGSRFEPGSTLSTPVRHCIPHIIDAVRRELIRLNVWCAPKTTVKAPGTWWDSLRPKTTGNALLR